MFVKYLSCILSKRLRTVLAMANGNNQEKTLFYSIVKLISTTKLSKNNFIRNSFVLGKLCKERF